MSLALAAGCSSGGSGTSSSQDNTSTTTTAPKFAGTDSAAFCTSLGEFTKQAGKLSVNPSATEAQRKAAWDQAVDSINGLATSAPNEIKPDVLVLAKVYSTLRTTLGQYAYDVSRLPEAEQKALVSESVQRSSSRLTAYDDQLCGGGTATSTTAP